MKFLGLRIILLAVLVFHVNFMSAGKNAETEKKRAAVWHNVEVIRQKKAAFEQTIKKEEALKEHLENACFHYSELDLKKIHQYDRSFFCFLGAQIIFAYCVFSPDNLFKEPFVSLYRLENDIAIQVSKPLQNWILGVSGFFGFLYLQKHLFCTVNTIGYTKQYVQNADVLKQIEVIKNNLAQRAQQLDAIIQEETAAFEKLCLL